MIEGKAAILVDSNVWIDAFVPMAKGHKEARRFLLAAQLADQVLLYPAHCVADVFYKVRAHFKHWMKGTTLWVGQESAIACRDLAWDCIKDMDGVATAVGVDGSDVWMALKLRGLNADLEDNFVLAAAERARVDYLVTSDRQLIGKATVAALTPQDMCAVLEAGI